MRFFISYQFSEIIAFISKPRSPRNLRMPTDSRHSEKKLADVRESTLSENGHNDVLGMFLASGDVIFLDIATKEKLCTPDNIICENLVNIRA